MSKIPFSRHSEGAFEDVIERYLLNNDYISITSEFDTTRAVFPTEITEFIRSTQPKEWKKLEAFHGEKTGDRIVQDLCKWMDSHGILQTIRHGFKCFGRTLRVAYFKAAHGMNPELEANYVANRVGIKRQLHYSERNRHLSLDVTITLNGLPIATVELKNPLTDQTVEDAKQQYRDHRDPRELIFEFKKRALVHFAVDTDEVWMTTRLAGSATHFLPFNRGYEEGAGNPPDPEGGNYRTAYLWEEVLKRDSLLDLLARFIHLQIEDKRDDNGRKFKKETMIFPRYHQLQAVRLLEEKARNEGVGHNYLIEHSAGSGKSNTIGWLAHRLSSLHSNEDERIFDSVVIITDRRVLDRQLQDTVYQFEHRHGVVQKIDEDSRQLAEALKNAIPIIITTVQKFPFVSRQLIKLAEESGEDPTGLLPTRNVAVIIDEAHSSQSGEQATELKGVLGGEKLRQEAAELADEEDSSDMEELYWEMAKRSKQANISFFAFTATPKHKTLKVFGRNGEPLHKYSMRQAIEEGFIMDVLRNYTTYKVFFNLINASTKDPNVERKKAASALARFMRLHPYNIAQKTEVMVEHFYHFTRHKIGGKAKAMVITGSRLEAVRYKQSFDKYIKKMGYPIKTLVAFSGVVADDKIDGVKYTEVEMNAGVRESEIPEKFATNEYQVLLVAEKYQTGFDQPLLHTMYIDRRLSGIQAVQTLSRLNRIHPLKEDTFVLDFVNDREEIRQSFKQFYEGAILGEEAEPEQLYQIKAELDSSGIYLREEVEEFCRIFFKPKQKQSSKDHAAMNATLDPAVDRYMALLHSSEELAEMWRGTINSFRNLYVFLSQVIPYQDSDLERLYTFIRHLSAKLPRRVGRTVYNFDDSVYLEYYRLQKISEGSINLVEGEPDSLDGPTAVGTRTPKDDEVPLSKVVSIINDRFGTEFTQADQLFFDQIVEAAVASDDLKQSAQVNSLDKFSLLFDRLLKTLFIERMDQNEEIFARYMNDVSFQSLVTEILGGEVYQRLVDD